LGNEEKNKINASAKIKQ